jgi:hypothetical protein
MSPSNVSFIPHILIIFVTFLLSLNTTHATLLEKNVTFRIEPSISVLVCSRAGGGTLDELMELIAGLWKANIKVSSKSSTSTDHRC